MVWVCEELAWTCYGSVGMLSVRVRFDTLFVGHRHCGQPNFSGAALSLLPSHVWTVV